MRFEIYSKDGKRVYGPETVGYWAWEYSYDFIPGLSEYEQLAVIHRWFKSYLAYSECELRVCSELSFLV